MDPLDRFVEAQEGVHERALREIRSGRKLTHWMWFVFPQIRGLGSSPMAQRYAIESLDEARAYLAHPVLGPRLIACAEAALAVPDGTASDIFGPPDDMKLRSSATLFERAGGPDVFARLLERFFGGERDAATLERL
jgi:uncharacterized protein (DUF1810 family)